MPNLPFPKKKTIICFYIRLGIAVRRNNIMNTLNFQLHSQIPKARFFPLEKKKKKKRRKTNMKIVIHIVRRL